MTPLQYQSAPPRQRRPLSLGDAIVVVALLVFVCGWVAGWAFVLARASDESLKHGWADALFLLVWFWPPVAAWSMVRGIVGR